MISELDVTIGYRITRNNHILLKIDGNDEEFTGNAIAKEYGTVPNFDDLETGSIYSAQLVDVGKVGYGLYANIGVNQPKIVDTLLPLHRLRTQLRMHNSPIRAISSSLVLA